MYIHKDILILSTMPLVMARVLAFIVCPTMTKKIVHQIFCGPLSSDMCELCDCDCLI